MVGEAAAASGSFPPALALALACSAVGSGLLLGGRNYTTSCFQQPRLAVFHPCSIRGQNSSSPDRRALAPSNDSSIRPVRLLRLARSVPDQNGSPDSGPSGGPRMRGEGKGSATAPVAAVGVAPKESDRHFVPLQVNPLRTTLVFGLAASARDTPIVKVRVRRPKSIMARAGEGGKQQRILLPRDDAVNAWVDGHFFCADCPPARTNLPIARAMRGTLLFEI